MSEAVIVCRDCGGEIARRAAYLECACRTGFSAGWDESLGEGRYLGRVIDPLLIRLVPEQKEVTK